MPGADEVGGARRERGPGRLAIRELYNEGALVDLDVAEYREARPAGGARVAFRMQSSEQDFDWFEREYVV